MWLTLESPAIPGVSLAPGSVLMSRVLGFLEKVDLGEHH